MCIFIRGSSVLSSSEGIVGAVEGVGVIASLLKVLDGTRLMGSLPYLC